MRGATSSTPGTASAIAAASRSETPERLLADLLGLLRPAASRARTRTLRSPSRSIIAERLPLGAGADREHGDHRADAEDHAEHGQRRAQLVRRQVAERRESRASRGLTARRLRAVPAPRGRRAGDRLLGAVRLGRPAARSGSIERHLVPRREPLLDHHPPHASPARGSPPPARSRRPRRDGRRSALLPARRPPGAARRAHPAAPAGLERGPHALPRLHRLRDRSSRASG